MIEMVVMPFTGMFSGMIVCGPHVWNGCQPLGRGEVNVDCLCIVGLSVEAQCAWNLASIRGLYLAVVVPLVGRCSWNGGWARKEAFCEEVSQVSIRSQAHSGDEAAGEWKDFMWIAENRSLPSYPVESAQELGKPRDLRVHCWSEALHLCLVHGAWHGGHNVGGRVRT